jgi:4-alpha-glucanotransferase
MPGSFPRASGILLHITSLPGPYGIGDMGPAARDFVDRLAAAGQSYWQVLPLNPTGFVDSPYQGLSSFAGNTNLISIDDLVARGWLTAETAADRPPFRARRAEYETVIVWHEEMLTLAWERFAASAGVADRQSYASWRAENAWWLDDYALFITLKEQHDLRAWVEWPQDVRFYGAPGVDRMAETLRHRIEEHRFRQWVFFAQWSALKRYANARGIRIIGDIPFYVGHDCCDVWVNRDLFDLHADGQPRFIAGVPPDSFSATGQRWGNPLYAWHVHRTTGYDWWIRRIDAALSLYDLLRIDHFRAFDRYWKIPATEPTAVNGSWEPGPGHPFFDALGKARIARIIAEDLGDDLGGAIDLRDDLGLPGMLVLQFAFSGSEADQARFLPGRSGEHFIAYTGTHDNNTTLGWWQTELDDAAREIVQRHTARYGITEPNWALIRLGMDYPAHTLIIPMQDVIGLGASARMNRPSVQSRNWQWRCTPHEMAHADWARLRDMSAQAGRGRVG